jgi:hypothetical protein
MQIRWDVVLGILASPLIVYGVQLLVDWGRRRFATRYGVFQTLMANRGAIASPDSVKALSLIDVVFVGDDKVRAAWIRFHDWVNDPNYTDGTHSAETLKRYNAILLEMTRTLGLDRKITAENISRVYIPGAMTAPQIVGNMLIGKLAQSVTNAGGLPVVLVNPPQQPQQPQNPAP